MALPYVARAMAKGLSLLGEPSLLNGASCGKVNLQRNVDLFAGIGDTADDNPTIRYDVASVGVPYAPKVGDLLAHPDGTFRLDRLVDDNGHVRRFIVVPGA